LAVLVVAGAAAIAAASQTSDTQLTMRTLNEALSSAFITSLDDEAFQDAANREEILLSLRMLSANADRLEEHANQLDASYDYLRRSLAKDCRRASDRFARGEFIATRFLLSKLTENCVACHTKREAMADFESMLLADPRVEKLGADDRLKLEIATREFERAITTCEDILLSNETIPEYVAVTGIFEDYLKLTIRVRGNTERPRATLQRFSQRTDLPSYIAELTVFWITALAKLELDEGDDIEAARELIEEAQRVTRFPSDRRGLVFFVAATRRLQRYMEGPMPNNVALSEAYYLLGLAESNISRSYWLAETEFFLERAIRVAPFTDTAREAFDLLEAFTESAYSGSRGIGLPPDVESSLEELRRLID
jgi:hypothetical protein